jgi:hypothetical protein
MRREDVIGEVRIAEIGAGSRSFWSAKFGFLVVDEDWGEAFEVGWEAHNEASKAHIASDVKRRGDGPLLAVGGAADEGDGGESRFLSEGTGG